MVHINKRKHIADSNFAIKQWKQYQPTKILKNPLWNITNCNRVNINRSSLYETNRAEWNYRSSFVKPEFLHIEMLRRRRTRFIFQVRQRLILWGRHRWSLEFQIPEPQAQGFYQNGMHRRIKAKHTNLLWWKTIGNHSPNEPHVWIVGFGCFKYNIYYQIPSKNKTKNKTFSSRLWPCLFQLLLFPLTKPDKFKSGNDSAEVNIELLPVQNSDL